MVIFGVKKLIYCGLFFNRRMSSHSKILVDVNNKLAVVTLNQPQKKNAIDSLMYTEITDVLETLSKNDDVTITAITGAGEYYCSGTNLKSSLGNGSKPMNEVIKEASNRLRKFVEAFISHNKILIAVVNGPAIGIAVTTLALCDIAYCVDTATFQTPFTRLGMSAEGCSSYTFPNIMGTSKANDMLLFNRKITAKEAYDWGLVAQIYSREQIDSVLWPEIKKNAAELPFKSLVHSKQLMRKFRVADLHEANRNECQRLEERWMSEDCQIAIMNFINRHSKL